MNKNQILRKNKWLIFLNVVIGTFMATLDGSIVNVALPTISTGLYVDITTVQWVVTSYLITVSSLLLVFGRISDIYGRRKLYFFGFIIFFFGFISLRNFKKHLVSDIFQNCTGYWGSSFDVHKSSYNIRYISG